MSRPNSNWMKRLVKSNMMALSTVSRKQFAVTAFWVSIVDCLFYYMALSRSLLSGIYYKFNNQVKHLKFKLIFCDRFGAFEEFKKRSVDAKGNLSAGQRLLCGLGAGVAEAIFAVTPMETVKVKFINDQRSKNPQFKGFFHGVRTIIKNEGL